MRLRESHRFKKAYKRLHQNQLTQVNDAIKTIIANPAVGEQKTGDLAWLRVHKFSVQNQLTLVGYSITPELSIAMKDEEERELTFLDLGSHENFYRDLKRK